jgi:hypothetical protein
MSRRSNPYENAMTESFMKTFKVEEVNINEYSGFTEVFANIEHFIEIAYNQKRLHSSLGYRTPVESWAEYTPRRAALAFAQSIPALAFWKSDICGNRPLKEAVAESSDQQGYGSVPKSLRTGKMAFEE